MNAKRRLDIEFNALFRIDRSSPPTLETSIDRLFQLRQYLRVRSPKLARWYLGGNTKEEALLYEAFDENGATNALLAVVNERMRQQDSSAIGHGTGLWNGEDPPDSASLILSVSFVASPSLFRLAVDVPEFITHENVLATTLKLVELWNPLHVSVKPYFYDSVFKTRPSAGWMLYLPIPLSARQVPEARTLVPLMKPDAKGRSHQTGTIIVSIDDGPFSEQNPEHVKRAHDIEIRLAGQDLLPHFGDPPSPPR